MTDQEKDNRFNSLLSKEGALSDDDIQELLSLWSKPTNAMVRPHIIGMFHGRMALEQIRSIRTFDRASGKLTCQILVLTVVLVALAVAQVVASAWPYLTSWISHGFRLR
ncbi:MAG: hypothetical protein LLG20_18120 [Acidobacteriales bacterium]|nr:hypothetical protein [Terriglobales bacterium]